MKKFLAVVLAMSMVLGLAACGASSDSTDAGKEETTETAEGEAAAKVAMVLPGDINDMGWCQSAYEGLVEAESTYGVEIAYTEKIDQVDYESSIREYAAAGYDLILCIGGEFADACLVVGEEFPEVMIADFNGQAGQEPNVASYRYTTTETGFLTGVLAGLMTESGVCGYVAGSGAAHIQDAQEAFVDGVHYVNPDYTALTANTDSMTDVALAKEATQAMIDQGADVVTANANTAGLGGIECAEEKGVKFIGMISDQYNASPDTVMVSMCQDNGTMVMAIVDTFLKGEFSANLNLFGMNEGAIYMSDWHGHDAEMSDEDMAFIEETISKVMDGSLKADGILRKSSFEQ